MGAPGSTMAGVAGSSGPAGVSGPKGPAGGAGAQGPTGVLNRWTSFRDFSFEFGRSDLLDSDTRKVSEITEYMNQNPSLQLGIDGSMDPRGTDPRSQDLSDRRVNTVREALIQAGVAPHRIQAGNFGDAGARRDRRVEVLVSTSN
jgi:outer membrane protein OmpA-like peptidoglycan-associated protein